MEWNTFRTYSKNREKSVKNLTMCGQNKRNKYLCKKKTMIKKNNKEKRIKQQHMNKLKWVYYFRLVSFISLYKFQHFLTLDQINSTSTDNNSNKNIKTKKSAKAWAYRAKKQATNVQKTNCFIKMNFDSFMQCIEIK